jgi:hypothetical protein
LCCPKKKFWTKQKTLQVKWSVPYAQKELVSKARKAAFKISKNLNHPFCGVNPMMKLFDALIKPIILYGSEIWGNNYITETFHNRFCKSVLGLSRNASKSATIGDLGRYWYCYIKILATYCKWQVQASSKGSIYFGSKTKL